MLKGLERIFCCFVMSVHVRFREKTTEALSNVRRTSTEAFSHVTADIKECLGIVAGLTDPNTHEASPSGSVTRSVNNSIVKMFSQLTRRESSPRIPSADR